MKQEIINQMQKIVDAKMEAYKSDFEVHDMNSMEDYDERFIWLVGRTHTHFIKLGEKYLTDSLKDERALYAMCQGNTYADVVISGSGMSYSDDELYYYDGDELTQIEMREAQNIWKAIKLWALWMWKVQNGMKPLPSDFKIRMSFIGCRKTIYNLLHSEKASNLLEILKCRRSGFKNCATDCVRVYVESENSLYFERGYYFEDNWKCTLNGGILYYNGKWNTHT